LELRNWFYFAVRISIDKFDKFDKFDEFDKFEIRNSKFEIF